MAFILSPSVLGICAYLDRSRVWLCIRPGKGCHLVSMPGERSMWPILADALEDCGYPAELCARFRRFRRPRRTGRGWDIYLSNNPRWSILPRCKKYALDSSLFRRLRRGRFCDPSSKEYRKLSTFLIDLANAHAASKR
jgi:hypothetical protein